MLKKITTSYTLALIGLIVFLGSCTKEYESIETTDDVKIQQFIKANNLQNVVKDSAGFYYQVVSQGTGENFKNTDSVLYHANLKSLVSGTTYYTDPANGNFGTLVGYSNNFNGTNIPAIRTSILALKPGGTVRILLPSYLAFGRNGFSTINIPSNELIDLTISTAPEKTQAALDDRLIREFIAAKGIAGMTKGPGGIYYVINAPGDPASPINAGSTVTAIYTGRYLDGTVFDSSKAADSTSFNLSGAVIPAWKKALPLVSKGGKLRILVPSIEGYGVAGNSPIPPNAVLDFDIEVTGVKN
jgi:FKBP-type peptidyl-prolyl cis-trans isomerase FkpA